MPAEADPALFATWARGWTQARGCAAPVAVPGGWQVDSVKPDHRWRFLYPGIDPAIAIRARSLLAAPFHLKVAAAAERIGSLLPADWIIDDSTCMMTRDPGAPPLPALPAGYRATCTNPRAGVVRIEIADASGGVAASGQIALVDDMAVFDQIMVDPAHRRIGLGRALVTALGRAANIAGTSIWMLAATAEGAALYLTLGWIVHAPYLTAMPPPAATA